MNNHGLTDIEWKELRPQKPYDFFVFKNFSVQEDYDKGFKIDELMTINCIGVATGNDNYLTNISREILLSTIPDVNSNLIMNYAYRPFDKRYIYYDTKLVQRAREQVMKNMKKENISLLCTSKNRQLSTMYFSVSHDISDRHYLDSSSDSMSVFPLYIYKENMGKEERIVNFNKKLYDKIAEGLNYLPCYDDNILVDPTSEYNGVLYPQDLFDYIYAVLHSPSYRERYKEFLKIDFPRIPYPTDWEKFRDLAEKGEKLRQLHLMEDLPTKTGVTFPVAGSLQVDCYRWQDNRVYINAEQYFDGVPESAWNFFIGGYQPA